MDPCSVEEPDPSPEWAQFRLDQEAQQGLCVWLGHYESKTPGCQCGLSATWFMGDRNAAEPELFLRISPKYGGQSSETETGYGAGAPELAVEVIGFSLPGALKFKESLYRREGMLEYVMVDSTRKRVLWRHLVNGEYQEIKPDSDGIMRSRVFPGLWLRPEDLWTRKAMDTVKRGLESPEHAEFAKKMAASRKEESPHDQVEAGHAPLESGR